MATGVRVVGRYALYGAIAAGGMATVHLGRLLGPVGFSRTVAIKRLHAHFAADPEFVSMFLDEARLAARIRHPNVVPTLDVVATGGELFLVMEYVPGESVARLSRALRERGHTIPLRILSAVMAGVLHGLHAAHEAKDERGHPLGIVHRDMSPQNVLVGVDGVARVLDFGVAKAAGRMQTTKDGQIKGKLSYMPPEQLRGAAVSRQTDIYAAGVMLWELLTGQRLFSGDNEGAIVAKILDGNVEAPSGFVLRNASTKDTFSDRAMRVLATLDNTVMRSLAMDPADRFNTAREMALEIERTVAPATGSEVADWVEHVANEVLTSRAAMVAEIESSSSHALVEPSESQVGLLTGRPTPSRTLAEPAASSGPSSSSWATTVDPPPSSVPRGAKTDVHAGGVLGANAFVDGPPVTQPSSISVASGMHGRAGARGHRRIVAALVGLALGVGVLATAYVWRHEKQSAKVTAEVPATSASLSPPIASAEATSNEPDAGGAQAIASSASNTTSASPTSAAAHPSVTARSTPASRPASPTRASSPTKPASGSAPANPADGCEPPFWYDAQGVKRYKPQCLGK